RHHGGAAASCLRSAGPGEQAISAVAGINGADGAAAVIRARRPGFTPAVAVVLGSGLGGLADSLQRATVIPYAELPGFPQPAVAGHAGRLILGEASGLPVALLQGRGHFYESGKADAMRPAIDTLARFGCPAL